MRLLGLVICALFTAALCAAGIQQDIEAHGRIAQRALQANQPAAAIREYQAILALDPQNLDAHANLGTVFFFSAEYAKAVPMLLFALERKPDLWNIAALLGMSEKRAGQAGAQSHLEAAFAHLTDIRIRVQVGMELIELCYASGDLNESAKIVGVLRPLQPTDPDILYTAHRIYADLADETTLAMAMASPESARMHQIMAQELARHGQSEAAIAQYREALRIAPRTPGLHFELAELLAASTSKADRREVTDEYEAALSVNALDEKAECRLGEISFRESNLKAAYDRYSRAVALAPGDPDANLGFGKTLLSLNQTARAMPFLERAVKDDPISAVAHYRLAIAYRSSGRAEEAARELAEFEKLKTIREKLSQVYKGMMIKPAGQDVLGPDPPM